MPIETWLIKSRLDTGLLTSYVQFSQNASSGMIAEDMLHNLKLEFAVC